MKTRDFDRFMAEREDEKLCLRILGRDCMVPRELPWSYMLRVERMLRTGEAVSGEENIALLRQVLSPEDFDYLTRHPAFKASWFWEIIAFGWLRADETEKPGFVTEDDLKIKSTDAGKNPGSAR